LARIPFARIPSSILLALLIAVGLVLWMASGYLWPGEARDGTASTSEAGAEAVAVQVRQQAAQDVTRYLVNNGQAEADRVVTVKAQTAGAVAEVVAEEGARVTAGEELVRIAMEDRQARLAEAKALVGQRETEFQAARSLGSSGFQARARVEEAEAALESARARLARIREDIRHTVVRAPFAGVLEERRVAEGDFLDVGSPVAVVADLDPLIVAVHIAQQRIGEVAKGGPASVRLAGGRTAEGTVRYVARTADESTRTFRVEVAVPNPDGAIPAGLSAEVRLPVGEARAHFVSPALLTLNDEGVLGVKSVDGDNRVRFHPVELVRSQPEGVWVSGLPDTARLITVGQGFAREGEVVRPVDGGRPAPAPGGGTAPVLPGAAGGGAP
jgi:multidrug efflux system membrane fusion protein